MAVKLSGATVAAIQNGVYAIISAALFAAAVVVAYNIRLYAITEYGRVMCVARPRRERHRGRDLAAASPGG